MLKHMSKTRLAMAWCVAVVVLGAIAVVNGTAITVGNGGLLLMTCLIPPGIMMLVWGGPPPLTVAEVLHTVESPAKKDRS